jgi:hypothetical protein
MSDTTRLQPRGPALGFPPMWIVYREPRDHPQFKFVVRLWYGLNATTECEGFQSIEKARGRLVEIGASVRLDRNPSDEPSVYEVWL